jgi:signal transduction histidine kinase/CheY-like chemotaxis protein/CHASE3 domain sensor protein
MNLKNLKIGTQLLFSLLSLLILVLTLGMISYLQSEKISGQTETIYSHPLQVRRALGSLNVDIVAIQRDMRDLIISADEKEIEQNLIQIENLKEDAFDQINIITGLYLGPKVDVDSLKTAFVKWHAMHDETIRLLRSGNIAEATNRTRTFGVTGHQADILLKYLDKIDQFAKNKGDELYKNSKDLNDLLNRRLIILVAVFLLISFIIFYILLRNIRLPLKELNLATRSFRDGNLNARSSYSLKNEFGNLSDSFNELAETLQRNIDLNTITEELARLMLSEDEAKKFFHKLLNALSEYTGSQMAAVYLLSEDKLTFEYFESIGLDDKARRSFETATSEGEFGLALSSRKVQHLKSIPDETRFVFNTVKGKFIPHEIITIPIDNGNEIIAVISLATVSSFEEKSLKLIDQILFTLSARIEGILAYHEVMKISEKLEMQNHELETQKTELVSQSAELISQSAELMKKNAELETQKKQLSEATRLKTNFLSNMSHELRTPLNSVIALSGVLNKRLTGKIPDEEYSYLEVIKRNGQHLLALINDILDISRIEAGRQDLEINRFNINELVEDVISMINPQAKQKNIELLFTKSDDNLYVISDTDKCHHIMQNIVGNAVKFTEKGNVTVAAGQTKNNIYITVSDTGIGISEDQIPHIFDEFRQADSTTSRRFGGTGLGLALARKYAGLLGGSVTVKSTIGTGSEFTLTLPVSYSGQKYLNEPGNSGASKFTERYNQPQTNSGNNTKTILLVEDSEPAIIQIKDLLEESGFQILVARDGGEAFAEIARTIPDAMILDLMMPGIDGFQVLKSIRESESTSHLPVLILTAKHITKEELVFLKENNVHQLIRKGDLNGEDLKNAIQTMVFPPAVKLEMPRREKLAFKGKPVVLVVEDNPDNMMAAKAVLAGNYSLLEATDGLEAVEMAKKHIPDLILMDIELPGMNGIDALYAIRKLPELNHVLVIALTASAMAQDQEAILAFGFDAYIAKPIEEKAFFKTINKTLYGE